jgi:hypothetical protein
MRYGKEYEIFLNMMEGIRKRLIKEISSEAIRKKILQSLANSDLIGVIKKSGIQAARRKSEAIIHRYL